MKIFPRSCFILLMYLLLALSSMAAEGDIEQADENKEALASFATAGPMAETGIGVVVKLNADMLNDMEGLDTETQFVRRKEYWHDSGGGYVMGLIGVNFAKIVTSPQIRTLWAVLFAFALAMYFSRMSNPLGGENKAEMLASLPIKFLFLPLIVQMDTMYAIAETARTELAQLVVHAMTETVAGDEADGQGNVHLNPAILRLFENADPLAREFEIARVESITKAFNSRNTAFGSTCTMLGAAMALKSYDLLSANEEVANKYALSREQFNYWEDIKDLNPETIKYGPVSVHQNNIKAIPILLCALGDEAYSGGQFQDPPSSGNSKSLVGKLVQLVGFGDTPEEIGYVLQNFDDRPEPLITFMEENGAVALKKATLESARNPSTVNSYIDEYRDLVFQAAINHIDQSWLKQMADFEKEGIFAPLGDNIAEPIEILRVINDAIGNPPNFNLVKGSLDGLTSVAESINKWLAQTLPYMLSLLFVLGMEVAVFFVYITYPLWFLKKSKAFPGWVQTLITSILFTFVFFSLVTVIEIACAQLMNWIQTGAGRDVDSVFGGRTALSAAKLSAAIFSLLLRAIFYIILAFMTPKITKKILEGQSFIGNLAMGGIMAGATAALATAGIMTGGAAIGSGMMKGGMNLHNKVSAAGGLKNALVNAGQTAKKSVNSGISYAKKNPLQAVSNVGRSMQQGTVGAVRLGQVAMQSPGGRAVKSAVREAAHAAASGGDVETYMRGRGQRWRESSLENAMRKQAEAKNKEPEKANNPAARD